MIQYRWSWKHYATSKKVVTKKHICYDFIHMKCSEQGYLFRTETESGLVIA